MGYRNFFKANFVRPHSWILAGMVYGFPKCCIDYFVGAVEANQHSREFLFPETEGMWFGGTGYIACPKCRELPEAEVRSAIEQNRFASTPFPEMREHDVDFYKALKRFKRHGVPPTYAEYQTIAEDLLKAAGERFKARLAGMENIEYAKGSYPAHLNEWLLRNRRQLVKNRLNAPGWFFTSTRTCGQLIGMGLMLGRHRGHYIWAVRGGSAVLDEVSPVLVRGFISEQGYYVPENPMTVSLLADELYESIWQYDNQEYSYGELNENLSTLKFRTPDLNYDFKIQLSGWYDRHGGPGIVRDLINKLYDKEYRYDTENDLPGSERLDYRINFHHPVYGWGDLIEFREFSKANDSLPMGLKIQYYFSAKQSIRFEKAVLETIDSAIKHAGGVEIPMTIALQDFTEEGLEERHIEAGDYVAVRFEERIVYFKDEAFQRKLWRQFQSLLERCHWRLSPVVFSGESEPLVCELPSFNQRAEINVEELIENLNGGNIEATKDAILRSVVEEMNAITPLADDDADQAGDENYAFEADNHDPTKWTMGMAHEIDSKFFAEPCNKGFGDELMAQVRERNENLQAPTEETERGHLQIISEQGDKALVQKTNFELYQEAGAMGSEKPEPSEPFYAELKTKYDENHPVFKQRADIDPTK